MGELKIRNWSRWQSYRSDRNLPPWIKVHRRLMNDPNWVALSDAERGQVVALWMLAADRDGRIPDDPKLLQRLCHMDTPPDINRLKELEFLDVKVTSSRRQVDVNVTPQTRLDKTREEKKDATKVALEDSGQNTKGNGQATPEQDYFRFGKDLLGKSAGGQLVKLLKAKAGSVNLSRATLEVAATKENPREYVAAVILKAAADDDQRGRKVAR